MQQNNARSLGEAIRSLRHSQSLTQQELSERLGGNLDSRYVRMIESGTRMPGRGMLLRLVAALGLRDRDAIDHMLELIGQKATGDEEFAVIEGQSAASENVPFDGALRCFQLLREFRLTAPGQDEAPRYHDLVLEALTRIFETQLRKPVMDNLFRRLVL